MDRAEFRVHRVGQSPRWVVSLDDRAILTRDQVVGSCVDPIREEDHMMTKEQLLAIEAGDVFTVRPRAGGYVMLYDAPLLNNWTVTCYRQFDGVSMSVGIVIDKMRLGPSDTLLVYVCMADIGTGWLGGGYIDEVIT